LNYDHMRKEAAGTRSAGTLYTVASHLLIIVYKTFSVTNVA